eukprot:1138467-Pelagomonas_calceolata.AAC.1
MHPPHQEKKKQVMGIRRVISCNLCLILLAKVERSLLKSVSGASKFIGIMDRMSMKLQSKPASGDLVSVKAKPFKGLQCVA